MASEPATGKSATARAPLARFGGKDSEAWREFTRDLRRHRLLPWMSVFFQGNPIVELDDVESVLEFGGGRDVTRALIRHFGLRHESVDVRNTYYPDHLASILDFPYRGEQYDLVCSFQCLEHNPWDEFDALVGHMLRFTRRYFYISLPYSGSWLAFSLNVRLPRFHFSLQRCFTNDRLGGRRFDERKFRNAPPEQHHRWHWFEVGRGGLTRRKLVRRLEGHGLRLLECFNNPFYPQHLFFLFEKAPGAGPGEAA